jgi:hypothetical protein
VKRDILAKFSESKYDHDCASSVAQKTAALTKQRMNQAEPDIRRDIHRRFLMV